MPVRRVSRSRSTIEPPSIVVPDGPPTICSGAEMLAMNNIEQPLAGPSRL